MADFYRTSQYFDSRYVVNNPQGRVLRLGDMVIVHPTETSTMREPYPAIIYKEYIKWVDHPGYEICLKAMNGYKYSAVMNDYGFNRLEPVKWMWSKETAKNKILIRKRIEELKNEMT